MAFRPLGSQHEAWQRFCNKNAALLPELDRISLALQTPSRFEELLQSGATSSKEGVVDLQFLTEAEWMSFVAFVKEYSIEWQSWFADTMYPAYFEEAKTRGVSHIDINRRSIEQQG